MNYILGISAFYHDSAAAILRNGEIVAAAQEERFTRKKHDASFPAGAIQYCLDEAGIGLDQVSYVSFYDKPWLKFERLLETYLAFAPRGFKSFHAAMPTWLKEKLYLKATLRRELAKIGDCSEKQVPELLFTEHHQSHAASAFFPCPFEEAAIICFDGVGEWATTSAWTGKGNKVEAQWELHFPHSLGLLYSAFTYYTGFKVNSGEYKLMGLAPYGEPKYADLIRKHLIDVRPDGTFRLDMSYFDYATGLRMTNSKFNDLFGGPPRTPETKLTQKEMDLARSIQVVTEEIVLRLVDTVHRESGLDNLCLAGGVALNCVANGRIRRESGFQNIWIQPAAGDAGGAVGSALAAWHEFLDQPREPQQPDGMQGAFLGPGYPADEVSDFLDEVEAGYQLFEEDELLEQVVSLLQQGKVIGWYQGRMEFGPRALGHRSILGDARSAEMQSVMNLKIKYRESFRPFAPIVRAEDVSQWFEHDSASPYMLIVADVKQSRRLEMDPNDPGPQGLDRLSVQRSVIPAVTHVDYSARLQIVHQDTNPRLHRLLTSFKEQTGCPVLVNTSFNVRGEPIVNTPQEAYQCFMRTEMDYLVLEDCLLDKSEQPEWTDAEDWRTEFELD